MRQTQQAVLLVTLLIEGTRLLTQLPAVTFSLFGNMTWILIPTGTWTISEVSVDISTGRCQVMEKDTQC